GQLNATADVPGTFTYVPAAGLILDAGAGQTLTVIFTPDDTVNYTTATQTVHINVAQATPTVSVSDGGGIYDGNPFPAIGTAVGVDGTTPVAGSFSFVYYAGSSASGTASATAPTNAGTYTVVATFTSSDPNYSNGTAQTTFTIRAISPTVSVSDTGGTYNGT